MCGGYGRSVFAAACLAMSRFLATAGRCSAALHTCVKGSAQAVKPDVCLCALFFKENIFFSTSRRPPSALLFFEGFEFLVCSKFNHTQCRPPCACAAACLHPHNSISNVVASVTIHDNTCVYIYISIQICIGDAAKFTKPLWKVVQIVRYTWVLVAKDKPEPSHY